MDQQRDGPVDVLHAQLTHQAGQFTFFYLGQFLHRVHSPSGYVQVQVRVWMHGDFLIDIPLEAVRALVCLLAKVGGRLQDGILTRRSR